MTVEHFSISEIKKNACVLVIGRKKSGKTNTCIDLLKKNGFIDKTGLIINYCEEDNILYKKEFVNATVSKNVNEIQLYKHLYDIGDYVVCDDCFFYKSHKLFETVIDSQDKLRIISLQFPFSIKPELANKIDYIFIQDNYMYPTAFNRLCNYFVNSTTINHKDLCEMTSVAIQKNHTVIVDNQNNKVFLYNIEKNICYPDYEVECKDKLVIEDNYIVEQCCLNIGKDIVEKDIVEEHNANNVGCTNEGYGCIIL